jgi:hypothetical protein
MMSFERVMLIFMLPIGMVTVEVDCFTGWTRYLVNKVPKQKMFMHRKLA